MKKQQRLAAILVSFLLLFSSYPIGVFAEEEHDPYAGMIDIQSKWRGSVFGDVGGQDKITAANFGISENAGGSVTLRSSNDRGKIAGSTEGIAYYFQEVAPDANFELTATAHVDSWTANNQVSFGIMLRGNMWENQSGSYTGEYVAVGALDQEMKALHKLQGGSLQKTDYVFNTVNRPSLGEEYELSIKKTGSLYTVRIGNETKTIDSYAGSIQYAGLYTARNTTITFHNVNLNVEGQIKLGDWDFSAFGGNTSADKNPMPTLHAQNSVTLATYGGKIASGDEGMSFYFKEIPVDANFELKAKAEVVSFNSNSSISTPNQKSFGLMLRDSVPSHGDSSTTTSNYVAIGALDTVIKGFYKKGTQTKLPPLSGIAAPIAGEEYELSIKKSGHTYVLTVDGQAEIVTLDDTFQDTFYAGVYAARDAIVTFSDMDIRVESKSVSHLSADSSAMTKSSYLVGESLDLTGLVVKAHYSDGSEALLTANEYIVTGFDSSTIGPNTITIHYNGASVTLVLQIIPLSVTSLSIKYYPAKTIYYPGDLFDPEGLVVVAEYNNGFQKTELTRDRYSFSIEEQPITDQSPYPLAQPGTYTVTVTSTETPAITAAFDVTVKSASITQLEIRQQPKQTVYFIGDSLRLDGLIVYAHYSDGSQVRLNRNEYEASPLDTRAPGQKQVNITHKSLTATLPLMVKEKELLGIEVTSYPKTTFYTNENFDSTGLGVSKVYDNSDKEAFSSFSLDTSKFNNQAAGVYEIRIVPSDSAISPITYSVTVRDRNMPEWKSIRFGQSTSAAGNQVTVRQDGSIELVALEGSGKVTGDHDGITFYYTELNATEDNFSLSADIQVLDYAKTPYDGQESFGIMARDAIGTHGNSSVFASNIATVGGYSGGTRSDNGTQLFVRTGVESSDGAGSLGIQSTMLRNERPAFGNTHPAKPYRLTLAKTNSGFTAKLNNGQEEIFYTPDILSVQDSNMYIGFYAARLATIVVSNVEWTVTSAATDSPRVTPPSAPITPGLDVLSLSKASETDYELILRPNVSGVVTVKQGPVVIAQDTAVEAGEQLAIPATLAAQSDTSFSITFLPDDTQFLTSYDKLVRNFTVVMRSYAAGADIYVSPTGTSLGDGSMADPLDIDAAIDFVQPGQRIIVLEGRYVRTSKIEIKKYNDGRADAKKYLVAAPGTRPVFDFDKKSEGVVLGGSYWHVKGLDFTRSAGNMKGFTVGGNYNVVEDSRFYANGDTGLQISRTDSSAQSITDWPSHNLILNSSSFDNRDPSDNNADGFAAKLTSGIGNVFRGCLAYNNIDDGWDLYTKAGSGAIGPVLIENSAAFNNGFLTDGTIGAGDKNGFKLGGEGIHVPHTIRDSIAFGNGAYGFTSNSNPGVIAINNIGFNNVRGNLSFTTYAHIQADYTINGFVSYGTINIAKDQFPSSLVADNNYMFDGSVSANKSGKQLTDANFASLIPVTTYARDSEGHVIWGDFLRLIGLEEPGSGGGTDPSPGSGGGGSGTSGDSNSSAPSGTPGAMKTTVQADGSVTIDLPLTVEQHKVLAQLNEAALQHAIKLAALDSKGNKRLRISIADEQLSDKKEYEFVLPSSAFSSESSVLLLEVITPLATFVLPENMLQAPELEKAKTVTLRVRKVETPEHMLVHLGNRPLIEYELIFDNQQVKLSSLHAAIQIGLPHSASAPASDNDFIVIWHVNADGSLSPMARSSYDAAREQAVFSTTHSSGQYAAAYHRKTFLDLSESHWANHAVEVLASRGVINGVSSTDFMPSRSVTRADFALLLVRVLGLTASGEGSFVDVQRGDYYYDELATAEKLGIVNGQADGRYRPRDSISRQDMFVMTARALKAAGALKSGTEAPFELNHFNDSDRIAGYALEDIAALSAAGMISGDPQRQLNPTAFSSRAEAAMLIFKVLMFT